MFSKPRMRLNVGHYRGSTCVNVRCQLACAHFTMNRYVDLGLDHAAWRSSTTGRCRLPSTKPTTSDNFAPRVPRIVVFGNAQESSFGQSPRGSNLGPVFADGRPA